MLILGKNIRNILEKTDIGKYPDLSHYYNVIINNKKKQCGSCIPNNVKKDLYNLLKRNDIIKKYFKDFFKTDKLELYFAPILGGKKGIYVVE